jgi:hypothetical protein
MRRGNEFRSWGGLTTGDEGSFVINFGTYDAVAIAQGPFPPPRFPRGGQPFAGVLDDAWTW